MSTRRLWVIVVLLALLAPVGIWLPERLRAGDAWGEWAPEDIEQKVGFIPRGLARLADLWKAPVPDYAPPGWEERPFALRGAAYIVSALLGVAMCGAIIWLLGRWLARKEKVRAP